MKLEVQTSLVEETDLKTKTMRIWCSGEVCLSGNGEERRSGESPLGRSAGLLNNKQQFFILLAPAITQPYIPLLSTDVITFIMCITSKDLTKVPRFPPVCVWMQRSFFSLLLSGGYAAG